jgi:hypothetical protein
MPALSPPPLKPWEAVALLAVLGLFVLFVGLSWVRPQEQRDADALQEALQQLQQVLLQGSERLSTPPNQLPSSLVSETLSSTLPKGLSLEALGSGNGSLYRLQVAATGRALEVGVNACGELCILQLERFAAYTTQPAPLPCTLEAEEHHAKAKGKGEANPNPNQAVLMACPQLVAN